MLKVYAKVIIFSNGQRRPIYPPIFQYRTNNTTRHGRASNTKPTITTEYQRQTGKTAPNKAIGGCGRIRGSTYRYWPNTGVLRRLYGQAIFRQGTGTKPRRQRHGTILQSNRISNGKQARQYFAGLAISTTEFQQSISFPFRRANRHRKFRPGIETRTLFYPFVPFDFPVSVLIRGRVPMADYLFYCRVFIQ